MLQLSPNPEVDWLLHSVQTGISSIHRQLPMVITPLSLVKSRQTGSRQKSEKVGYDVGIEGFLRWHLNWGQSRIFLKMFNSA
jgi:hypothetical protein